MELQLKQEVQHSQFGRGIVQGIIDATHAKVLFDDDPIEKIISPKFLVGYISAANSIFDPSVVSLPDRFVDYLFTVKNQVHLRFHYPKHLEPSVLAWISREGLDLPSNHRAIKSGSRGGSTVQRSAAGTVRFPTPTDDSFVPRTGRRNEVNGETEIHSLALVLSLWRMGFSITSMS